MYVLSSFSAKRKEVDKDFQQFTDVEDLQILKHCPTRWLSLDKAVTRTLNQYPALVSYFKSHEDNEKPGRVKRVFEQLNSPLTRLTLHFLAFILPAMNDFNKAFQVSVIFNRQAKIVIVL